MAEFTGILNKIVPRLLQGLGYAMGLSCEEAMAQIEFMLVVFGNKFFLNFCQKAFKDQSVLSIVPLD